MQINTLNLHLFIAKCSENSFVFCLLLYIPHLVPKFNSIRLNILKYSLFNALACSHILFCDHKLKTQAKVNGERIPRDKYQSQRRDFLNPELGSLHNRMPFISFLLPQSSSKPTSFSVLQLCDLLLSLFGGRNFLSLKKTITKLCNLRNCSVLKIALDGNLQIYF